MSACTSDLPEDLYTAEQVRELDRITIEEEGVAGLVLMRAAGQAAFDLACVSWPDIKNILLVCGLGNNAGDGYVFARLAKAAGLNTSVLQTGDVNSLKGDAKTSYEDFLANGGEIQTVEDDFNAYDLIIDALLGTGLDRDVSGEWKSIIERINASGVKVLALDIPSGLNANTGAVMGAAITANITITFIGMKQGLLTGKAAEHCGEIYYASLDVPDAVFEKSTPANARQISFDSEKHYLKPRKACDHKGRFGHVLTVGGDEGYIGAVRMAAEAAARSGAGLVSVATRQTHAATVNIGRPELMCHGVEDINALESLVNKASVIAIGPGLGQSNWSRELFSHVIKSRLPIVLDADGLNLLAEINHHCENRILTPHPGEAARLLDCSVEEVENDRFNAARNLKKLYGGVIVLKGSGTIIMDGNDQLFICTDGNPGMASGGMGDVLTGVIAGLLAQGLDLSSAAKLGVCLHARAADEAAAEGQRGLLAGDLMSYIRYLIK